MGPHKEIAPVCCNEFESQHFKSANLTNKKKKIRHTTMKSEKFMEGKGNIKKVP